VYEGMCVTLFLKLLWCACKGVINFGRLALFDNVLLMLSTPDKSVNQTNLLLGDYRTLN
jgi:hypothetical protein